jgi:hypothetical protein
MGKRPLDTLLALKAICLHSGLSSNERRVGAALIEHYNRRNAQCDPGLVRLAALLGIHERTVMRAIDGLLIGGLFEKVRHGGHSGRNFYAPVWARLDEIRAAWDGEMRKETSALVTKVPGATGQTCQPVAGASVTQTCQINLLTETCSGLPGKERVSGVGSTDHTHWVQGSMGAQQAAVAAAERRWTTTLNERFGSMPVTYAEIIDQITPEIQAAATEAELKRRGAGIDYILNRLRIGTNAVR